MSQDTPPLGQELPILGDVFDGAGSPNADYWALYDAPGTNGNGYNHPENVRVQDGNLVITGRGDDVGGLCWCGPATPDYAFGDYEFRVRVDKGKGYSMVIGMWPDSERWPIDGEIDLVETPRGDRSVANVTLHYGETNEQFGREVELDFSEWQDVTLRWRPTSLTVLYGSDIVLYTEDVRQIPQTPMHPFIQLDVEDGKFTAEELERGPFIPFRDSSTPSEVRLEVDRVKFTPLPGISKAAGAEKPIRTVRDDFGL